MLGLLGERVRLQRQPAVGAVDLVLVTGAVVDVGQFDTSSDAAYVDRLYIPGIRRAGDLQTAVSMATGRILIHNAGPSFDVTGPTLLPQRLSVREIVKRLKQD